MRKTFIKILMIIMMCIFIFSNFYTAYASVVGQFKDSSVTDANTGGAVTKIHSLLGIALTVTRNVGVGLAILILLVLGCKYMLASAGDRAEIKKYAVTYVIGAVVLFAASGILTIIKTFTESATGAGG